MSNLFSTRSFYSPSESAPEDFLGFFPHLFTLCPSAHLLFSLSIGLHELPKTTRLPEASEKARGERGRVTCHCTSLITQALSKPLRCVSRIICIHAVSANNYTQDIERNFPSSDDLACTGANFMLCSSLCLLHSGVHAGKTGQGTERWK